MLEQRDALADAARAGAWAQVLPVVEQTPAWVNAPRPGSRSGYTPLHQAAWHGADSGVVQRMLDAGGLRTVPTADGARPVDIARSHGHPALAELLDVDTASYPDTEITGAMQVYLHALMVVRPRQFGIDRTLRLPPVEPVIELAGGSLWCPVPGMYGGFGLVWDGEAIVASSWCRVAGGSGQRHRITEDGVELTESGFV